MQWNNKSLEELAEKCPSIETQLKEHDERDIWLPLGELCTLLNITLKTRPMSDMSGFICIDKEDKEKYGENYQCTIFVNATDCITRQRFTIAHEIGHFCYDMDELKNSSSHTILERRARGKYTPEELEKEKRANEFAAELLMPQISFIKLYDGLDKKNPKHFAKKLISRFAVSEISIGVRLQTLGLL